MKPLFVVKGGCVVITRKIHPRSQIEALGYSIRKWRLVAFYMWFYRLFHKHTYVSNGGKTTCACCLTYIKQDCVGCPIWEFTDEPWCNDTPYEKYRGCPTYENARAELKFLKALLVYHKMKEGI